MNMNINKNMNMNMNVIMNMNGEYGWRVQMESTDGEYG